MLSVCLRHAANNFAEHKNTIHLVFFDGFPRYISFVIRYHNKLILHHLKALNVCRLIVEESINPIPIEALNADIDEKKVSRLDSPAHAIATDVNYSDLIGLTSIKHLAGISF
ncbi:hypothetical protein KLAE6086_12975 [Klebsiella aerogenes]|nr:Uncharacterised protein [Klebsiella aerogenes]